MHGHRGLGPRDSLNECLGSRLCVGLGTQHCVVSLLLSSVGFVRFMCTSRVLCLVK